MTQKTEKVKEFSGSDAIVIFAGAIFLIVLLIFLSGIAFTWLFNTFFIPIFLPDIAPLSWQSGLGLYLLAWFIMGFTRSVPRK